MLPRRIRLFSVFLAALLFFTASPTNANAQTPSAAGDEINRLMIQGGCLLKKGDHILFARDADSQFVPASIIKVATAFAALRILGSDYRFKTRFYSDNKKNLYIQGYGDPFLISEEVEVIMDHLKQHHIEKIQNIFLDDTAFNLAACADGVGKSLNPYDAANNALAVNFNTVNITVAINGSILSAEPQTPTLPIMARLGEKLPPGTHRISITRDRSTVMQHTGELFRALQKEKGIPGAGRISIKAVPTNLTPVYVHTSTKKMEEIIRAMLLYSTNFIANQLYLAIGAEISGYPATWEKARHTVTSFLQEELGLDDRAIAIEEGAGISRKNRITPRGMITILEAFKKDAHLLPLGKNKLIKSGTLNGVYSYAGYFQGGHEPDPFVLILNQKTNNRDRLLNLLEKLYLESP